MIKASKLTDELIASLPSESRSALTRMVSVSITRENFSQEFEEMIMGKEIASVVPKSLYPAGNHYTPDKSLPFLSFISQKNFIGFYHMALYAIPELVEWFKKVYPEEAKYKLDMGKARVRLKRIDDIPYKTLSELLTRITPRMWIERYEAAILK